MYVQRNVEARSRNHCYCGKAVSIAYSKCMFVTLVFYHAIRMNRIILPFVACPALPHFSALSHKRYDFCGKDVEHKMCVVILCTSFVSNIKRDAVMYVLRFSCKVSIILVRY